MTIFIPEKIRVGYQERSDTYTKKLAYVIYYRKNKLCKETSWQHWRSSSIEPNDFENVPTAGFVLNKKTGDYSSDWGHRMAHVRVYDPRNFEFEITVENLLYILENATSTKGKGLEGEFIYGWDSKDLILIPVDSPDYAGIKGFSSLLTKPEKIFSKDLVLGGTYLTNKQENVIYMGRYMRYVEYSWRGQTGIEEGLHYFFYGEKHGFLTFKSISGRILKVINTEISPEYAEIMDKLESKAYFSPIDESLTKYIPLTWQEFNRGISDYYWGDRFLMLHNNESCYVTVRPEHDSYSLDKTEEKFWHIGNNDWRMHETFEGKLYDETYRRNLTKEDLFNRYNFVKKETYLRNGKLHRLEGVKNVNS